MRIRLTFATICLSLLLAFPFHVPGYASPSEVSIGSVQTWYRTELYFGRSIPGGGAVSDTEWEKFLDDVVAPRFPDGFTVLKATGHYREQSGKIITEPSEVLIFLYPANKRTSSRRNIEEIRRAYVRQFKQESVLRLDFVRPVKVSF
jgi:hypothetical protein